MEAKKDPIQKGNSNKKTKTVKIERKEDRQKKKKNN